jgi:hypothetical protein
LLNFCSFVNKTNVNANCATMTRSSSFWTEGSNQYAVSDISIDADGVTKTNVEKFYEYDYYINEYITASLHNLYVLGCVIYVISYTTQWVLSKYSINTSLSFTVYSQFPWKEIYVESKKPLFYCTRLTTFINCETISLPILI